MKKCIPLIFLCLSFFISSCDDTKNDKNPVNPNGKKPGDWRWPEVAGSDGLKYGEQSLIPGGTFEMGWRVNEPTPINETGTRPSFQCTVSPFWIDRYEVTNLAFRDYVNRTNPTDELIIPRDYFRNIIWFGDTTDVHDNYAVQPMSWWATVFYANWRSRLEGLDEAYTITGSNGNYSIVWDKTKNGYRLPTEAEWEFAARAGNQQRHFAWGNQYFYDTTNHIAYCSFYANGYITTFNIPVNYAAQLILGKIGRFRPNNLPFGNGMGAYGLFDMNGNTEEWVWDWYAPYTTTPKVNPSGPEVGTEKVRRGGNNFMQQRPYMPSFFLNYDRGRFRTDNSNAESGFRLARNQ